MKKSLVITSIVIILALIGGGVFWYVNQVTSNKEQVTNDSLQNEPADEQVNQEDEPVVQEGGEDITSSTDEEIDISNWKTCKNIKLQISLEYPDDWGECWSNDNLFFIKTNKSLDNKYIVFWIDKTNGLKDDSIKEKINNGSIPVYNHGWNRIFKMFGYAGTIESVGLFIDDNFYWVNFSIEDEVDNSNPGASNRADWAKDRIENIWNVAKTIKKIE